jgi:hypothetical protein
MSGLRLVPLQCAGCHGRLAAAAGAVFLLCPDCGAGFEVMDDGTLATIPVSFARYGAEAGRSYPFWTFEARLRLTARTSDRPAAATGGLFARFQERGALRFYCAAYAGDFESNGRWSLHLTMEQPTLAPAAPPKDLEPVAFSQADARRLASDLFVTSELALPDTVRALVFELDLTDPRLAAIAL